MQKPSVRPGRSPRARPTGAPQSAREQNRLRSGTSGFASTMPRGSGRGTPGTWTRPAPSRPRPLDPAVEPELRTDTERPVERPDSERESRPDTERRDREERDDREDGDDCEDGGDGEDGEDCGDGDDVRAPRPVEREPPPPAAPAPPAVPAAGEPTEPVAGTTGARPQVSQYSSPPPMSSYVPSQSGR
ncbi:hypothetical protein SZN_34877 [Streptomyces zinciresistens K42]|uniref:Uncharacterized protein n=1 Tax=Streptomyces zinciresistens K42 TaxID=700597 RepID=G2GN70_9ACTN|nr:hypothetical protein SZN_34877 [Streptomyces zinciresistens K42]